MIDPDQFVITRRRKKYKFAKFANASNCFELDEWQGASVLSEALPSQCLTVELGAGTGLFSVELAAQYPEQTFLAIDVKADRLQKGAHEAINRDLTNIFFVRARADQLPEIIKPQSLTQLWLTFPDPFPRKGASGRRLTHSGFLQCYQTLLAPGGSLLLKHDNPGFFYWSLEQLVSRQWRLVELSFDLHASDLSEDYKLLTTYEQRWLGEGRITHFVRALSPDRL